MAYINELMNDSDAGHIQLICDRHGIAFWDEQEAVGKVLEAKAFNLLGDSFSIRHRNAFTDELIWTGIHVVEQGDEEANYFTALHELGHTLLGHRESIGSINLARRVEQEMEAWTWAFDHANYWPSDDVICGALDSLSTYTHLEDAIQRGEIKGTLDAIY